MNRLSRLVLALPVACLLGGCVTPLGIFLPAPAPSAAASPAPSAPAEVPIHQPRDRDRTDTPIANAPVAPLPAASTTPAVAGPAVPAGLVGRWAFAIEGGYGKIDGGGTPFVGTTGLGVIEIRANGTYHWTSAMGVADAALQVQRPNWDYWDLKERDYFLVKDGKQNAYLISYNPADGKVQLHYEDGLAVSTAARAN